MTSIASHYKIVFRSLKESNIVAILDVFFMLLYFSYFSFFDKQFIPSQLPVNFDTM